uniref:Uncharacterized protein n=1 Tax=Manihot esculenta TaxID=3983 RepID=A0A2C9V563_MANES
MIADKLQTLACERTLLNIAQHSRAAPSTKEHHQRFNGMNLVHPSFQKECHHGNWN